jgi:hypothetical protein
MKIFKFVFLLFILSLSVHIYGQVTAPNEVVDDRFKGIIFRNELSFDLRFYTQGISLGYTVGNIKTFYRSSYYHYEIGTFFDDQEFNQSKVINVVGAISPNKFKYGKQNSAFVLRASSGSKKYLTDKAKRKGVSIGYSLEGGASLAILKPYYLNVVEQEIVNGEPRPDVISIKYSEENKEKFLNYASIYGSAGFTKGLTEVKFVPGVQVKSGIFFSTGVFDKIVKNGEVGIMADFFIKKLPILVETDKNRNTPLFLNLYVNLQLGNRRN